MESSYRFNEAPAEHGGNPSEDTERITTMLGFNEAPAEHGGNPWLRGTLLSISSASMRAPAEHGGNPVTGIRQRLLLGGFNEAPAEHGGNLAAETECVRLLAELQ